MTTFTQYGSDDAYEDARDYLTAQFENDPLYLNNAGSGLFYYDSGRSKHWVWI